jgi:D-alanyl-D-alanine dipeptidase
MTELSLISPVMVAEMAEAKNVQFRGQVPPDVDFLIRAIAPLKNSGKDWSVSDVLTEALVDWLRKPENQALVERHNLMEALEKRGLTTDVYSDLPDL